jgi:hypothetical protein
MVIFSDSRHYMCRREEAQMMIAAQKVNEALKDLSEEEASFMVENHEVIEPFLEVSAGSLGVASFMVGQHLENLKGTLIELEKLHQQQYRQHGHLRSRDFFTHRKRMMAKINASLGPLVRKGTGIPDHPRLKRAWVFLLAEQFTIGTRLAPLPNCRAMQRIFRAYPEL